MKSHMPYEIGDTVSFGYRAGYVIGYSTFKRTGTDQFHTYLIVQLNKDSAAYLEAIAPHRAHDMFISLVIINPESVDTHNGSRTTD